MIKQTILFITLIAAPFTSLHAIEIYHSSTPSIQASGSIQTAFSPQGHVQKLLIKTINHAKYQILVMSTEFTSKPIAQALLQAKMRGIDVKILLNPINLKLKYGQLKFFSRNDIPIWIDNHEVNNQSNLCVIDANIVVTGAFNFTEKSKQASIENVIVLSNNKKLADSYAHHWIQHAMHAKKYTLSVKHSRKQSYTEKKTRSLYRKGKDGINKKLKEKQDQLEKHYREAAKKAGQDLLNKIF